MILGDEANHDLDPSDAVCLASKELYGCSTWLINKNWSTRIVITLYQVSHVLGMKQIDQKIDG